MEKTNVTALSTAELEVMAEPVRRRFAAEYKLRTVSGLSC